LSRDFALQGGEYAILFSVINLEKLYIPVGEMIMEAKLHLPQGEGPFELLVWLMPDDPEEYPMGKAVLLICDVVDHPLWFAALCAEIRLQDFFTKEISLWVDLPVIPFKSVAHHPFLHIAGKYADEVKRYLSGKVFS
jgi:hypothetical protein